MHRPMPLLALAVALLPVGLSLACPADPPPDAGLVDAAQPEPPVDAGDTRDASVEDAGEGEGDDGGAVDAGASDAGAPDAGFVCTLPAIEPPPDPVDDAGPPACGLVDIDGAIGNFGGTWEGEVFGSFPLTGPFEMPARGEMSFKIYCGDTKLLVDGILDGRAYQHPDAGPEEPGHPFSGRLYGEYDPESAVITMIVKPATLTVGPFDGTFEVSMSGHRTNDAFEDGEWCGYTTAPVGGAGSGSWRAERG